MKRTHPTRFLALAGIIALMISGALVNSAKAQGFTVTITVDEDGNGRIVNTSGFNSALAFAMMPDPGPGGLPSALTYDLLSPPGLTAGDFQINDAVNSLSDIVRFNPQQLFPGGGRGTLVFYSKAPGGSLADTDFPTALYANNLTVPEGPNDITTYTPTAGQPGFVSGASGPVTYIIKSNVPDTSSSSSLMLLGLSGIVCFRRITKK